MSLHPTARVRKGIPAGPVRRSAAALAVALGVALAATQALALDSFRFDTPGATKDMRAALAEASLVNQARREKRLDPQDLFTAALADYGNLLGALYALGHYGGTIHILIDGREASSIAPLEVPDRIGEIVVSVEPGPPFTFSKARMKPYAPGTDLPHDYLDTAPARSTAIVAAAETGVEGWRSLGHAKARVAGQDITADHRTGTVDSWIYLEPGPVVRFGNLLIGENARIRPRRMAQIADFPTGQVYNPKELEDVARRLRRTGVFKSVVLTEADRLGPGDTLDFSLEVVEEKKRRFGIGAELSNFEGLTLTGYWLHRNLFGGAERFKVDAAISGIEGQSGGADYSLGARIDRPATFTRDTTAYAEGRIESIDEQDYRAEMLTLGFGVTHEFSDSLTARGGLSYEASDVTDAGGKRHYRLLALPIGGTWDKRNSKTDATDGFYMDGQAKPFLGFGTTGTGAQITGDLRAYRGFGIDDRFVVAGRLQLGTVTGPTLLATPRDYLFYSGGGGTVRGQPYQSLGVNVLRSGATTVRTGGQSFAALSVEGRMRVTNGIGAVAFADAGYVTAFDFFGGIDGWHSGAGIGLRYQTPIGPIRLDIAAPVGGNTGGGVQVYLGIGQSF